ncbi:Plasma membrane t-SNARE, secretory vesicle fusion [Kappamyces sp. JEL0680]|nr:Plasma membrane t-SNARE, secretory vesicle fusion [Kappamyces sp. JEL0680]
MSSMLAVIDRIEGNITAISRFHERALVGVSQDETNRITRQLDDLQDETNGLMDRVRTTLKRLSDETKRLGGSEAQSRKAQQASAAMKLQNAAQRYAQVQKYAKEQYKKRMEREIRIARPDASERDIERAVNDSRSGSAFAQEMLNSRIGAQRRVLQEVQGRHEELRKMEASIEELATLFMDLQVLLETQQNQIDTIETQVEYTAEHIEEGGREIKRAISIRKSSRKKMWYIVAAVVILILILAAIAYIQRCQWFGVQCSGK